MNISFRSVEKNDIATLLEIYRYGVDQRATFETGVPTAEEWERKYLETPRLIAEVGGEIAGYAVLSPVSSRHVYRGVAEVSCYIAPAYIGKGIGTQLLRELLARAQEAGFWTIEAKIIAGNTASIRICEKCGFRLVGIREKLGCNRDGVWQDIVLMEFRFQGSDVRKNETTNKSEDGRQMTEDRKNETTNKHE